MFDQTGNNNSNNNNNNNNNSSGNNASTPAGDVYGNGNGNSNNNNNDNNGEDGQNNSVAALAKQLTSGVVLDTDKDVNNDNNSNNNNGNNNSNNNNTNNNGDDKDTDPSAGVIANLAKGYKGELLTEGIDLTKIGEGLSSGDLQPIADALETAASAAHDRAIKSVLNLIPEIQEHMLAKVMEQVNAGNNKSSAWNNFIDKYPDYAEHKAAVEPFLEKSLKGGKNVEQAYAAVDFIFSGEFVGKNTNKNLNDHQGNRTLGAKAPRLTLDDME